MMRRDKLTSTRRLIAWTAISFAAGASVAALALLKVPAEMLQVPAIAVLLVTGLLLSLAKDGYAKLTDLASLTDNAPDDVRDRWLRYIEEKHLELQVAVFVQYGLLVVGVSLFGIKFASVEAPSIGKLLEPDAVPVIGFGLCTALVPGLWRVLAAPRRILSLRHDLVNEVKLAVADAKAAEQAIERSKQQAVIN